MTDGPYAVRSPRVEDAEELGRLHVKVWREAYADDMPAEYLAGLDPVKSAERWKLRFEVDEPDGIVVVATGSGDEIVGFASAGPTRDEDAPTEWELYAVNVVAEHHGTGVADRLLTAVLGERSATLWVIVDNGRAEAFYRRHGFTIEGATKLHDGTGTSEMRMVRRSVAADR
jgi:ribosomal protein S18 acetylase RimI-like enzyme